MIVSPISRDEGGADVHFRHGAAHCTVKNSTTAIA